MEKEKCMKPECSAAEMEIPDPECPVTLWSDWSPCSVTCGSGVRIRTRQLLIAGGLVEMCTKRRGLYEQQPCSVRSDCLFDAIAARGNKFAITKYFDFINKKILLQKFVHYHLTLDHAVALTIDLRSIGQLVNAENSCLVVVAAIRIIF